MPIPMKTIRDEFKIKKLEDGTFHIRRTIEQEQTVTEEHMKAWKAQLLISFDTMRENTRAFIENSKKQIAKSDLILNQNAEVWNKIQIPADEMERYRRAQKDMEKE